MDDVLGFLAIGADVPYGSGSDIPWDEDHVLSSDIAVAERSHQGIVP